jgi:hypothetical protein
MQQYGDSDLKSDLKATVRTAQELGPDYESDLIDGFIQRLDSRLDAQVATRVRRELDRDRETGPAEARGRREPRGFGTRFHYVPLVAAIPLRAIAVGQAHLPGLIMCWLGIVGVNVAHAATAFGGRRSGDRAEARADRARRQDGWD